MRTRGEAYSRRLETFSDNTLRLIMKADTKATCREVTRITAETDYSEAEVVAKLKELLATISTGTDTAP